MPSSKIVKFPPLVPAPHSGGASAARESRALSSPALEALAQIPDLRERMADVIESISDGFALYDSQDRIVLWNEKYASIISYARHLLRPGVPFEILVRECAANHFRGQLISDEEKETWIREAYEFQATGATYERQTADGRCYLVSRRKTEQDYMAVVWTDITERKAATDALKANERLYRELIEGSLQGVVIHTDDEVVLVNRAFLNIFGLEAAETPRSLYGLDKLFIENDRDQLREIRRSLFEGNSTVADYQIQATGKDGHRLWVQVSSLRVDWHGRPAVQSTYVDVTERIAFQEELMERRLEAVGMLARGIAMEFHKVHSQVMGALHLAKMEAYAVGMHTVTELLNETEQLGGRVNELTQQLLFLYRRGIPVKETVTVEQLFRDALPFEMEQDKVVPFRKMNVDVKIRIGRSLWPLQVDKGQLTYALRAVIRNGLTSMPFGGALQVSAENHLLKRRMKGTTLLPGRYVKVSVLDEGNVLPEELLSRIFDPYFSSLDGKGGLELASAYSIIRQHDGAITVAARRKKGMRLTIFLPVAD
jgi:PAS domain S-box-containing protein